MAKRSEIAGTVVGRDAEGAEILYRYSGTYGEPRRDEGGMLEVGWSVDIEGIESQPPHRITHFRTASNTVDPALIKRVIEQALVEHLQEPPLG